MTGLMRPQAAITITHHSQLRLVNIQPDLTRIHASITHASSTQHVKSQVLKFCQHLLATGKHDAGMTSAIYAIDPSIHACSGMYKLGCG